MELKTAPVDTLHFLAPGLIQAGVIHSFEGSKYDTFRSELADVVYDTSMSVSGFFQLDKTYFSLGDSNLSSGRLGLVDITPSVISFSFTDGAQAVTENDNWSNISFRLATNDQGDITRALIDLQDNTEFEESFLPWLQIKIQTSVDSFTTDSTLRSIGQCIGASGIFCNGGTTKFTSASKIAALDWAREDTAVVPLPGSIGSHLIAISTILLFAALSKKQLSQRLHYVRQWLARARLQKHLKIPSPAN